VTALSYRVGKGLYMLLNISKPTKKRGVVDRVINTQNEFKYRWAQAFYQYAETLRSKL
jgi:hypothetical protein|tara:strand:+ start:31972 stop:32145 length:174 start_codon:yes stop_codon:yes gene_type:complete